MIILDFVVEMLSWNKLRYIPVENVKGKLIGLVTSNAILQHLIKKESLEKESMITAGDIMVNNPVTIGPDESVLEAIKIMMKRNIGCLPVVKNDELIGLITEANFLSLSAKLIIS